MNPLAWIRGIRGLLAARNASTEALQESVAEAGRLTKETVEKSVYERHQLQAAQKAARVALTRLRAHGNDKGIT